MLRAGVATVDITPPAGVRMAGFAGRTKPALAVHDPLSARVLALDDGERRVGLVAIDLLYVSEDLVAQVRSAAGAHGIAPDGLLVASTHTHSGPDHLGDEATPQERAYWEELPRRVEEALARAVAALEPARLGAASGWCAVGINRREKLPGGVVELGRNHFGKFDPQLGLVRVDRADGSPLAALVNYACHPVCLMEDSYLISADYPGAARYFLEEQLGGGMALFFNGACGNVNPREAAVSIGVASGGSPRIVERAGREVAREAARIWHKAHTNDEVSLSFARRVISLPTNLSRGLEAAERALAQAERLAAEPAEIPPYITWRARPSVARARAALNRLKERGSAPVQAEIQAIRIGPVALVGWPGEVFCELGMEAKEQSPFRHTLIIGYANGIIGYVPTPEAYSEGGYEAESAAYLADEAGLVLVEESVALLKSLAGG